MEKHHEHGQSFQCKVTSEASKAESSSTIFYEEVEDSNSQDDNPNVSQDSDEKPKILIQRVFHQPTKGIVEQKLDYVIAKSDKEITKHVFGGLFKNKYYPYLPENYCLKHNPNLMEHKDETLLKLGDKFDSLETFRLYIDSNARRWKYYLKCADSHRKNGKLTFVFRCVFASPVKTKYYVAQGLRKRTSQLPKGDCPCRVIIKPVPANADNLTVIYVCHHHDHAITDEYFNKLQHGRRIHPSIREEIMDLLSLDVDREIVKKYFESLTGYKMHAFYFHNILNKMKKNNIERQFSLEKLKEMSRKIEKIKEELGIADKNEEENVDNDLTPDDQGMAKDKATQIKEAINVLRAVSAPKKTTPKPKLSRNPNLGRKRSRYVNKSYDEDSDMVPVNNKSRLETRLQELTMDQETLDSIKHLQDSVRGEMDYWPPAQREVEVYNRSTSGHKTKRTKNHQKPAPTAKPKLEPQTIVIENTQNYDEFMESQEIIDNNEITTMEVPADSCNEVVVYEDQVLKNNAPEIVDSTEFSYCIQYDNGTVLEDQTDQDQFILIENLENVPEVHIQATDLATVSIVSKKDDEEAGTEENKEQTKNDSIVENNNTNTHNDVTSADGEEVQLVNVISDNIKVLGDVDASLSLNEDTVYEVIQTDDKKIFPTREVVLERVIKPNKIEKTRKKRSELNNLIEQNDLDDIGDDDYYMIVVENDDDEITEDIDYLDNYDEDDNTSNQYIKEEVESYISNEIMDESATYCENKRTQCNILSTENIDREVKIINRLKRIRKTLERDIKRLVDTKDELVNDIMNAKRLRRITKDTSI